MEKVSIIIPCYNNENFIRQAVMSALGQSFEPKEVIVIDDGSEDETKEILKGFKDKVQLILLSENKGASAARNVGIKAASGEFILVLDSDDFFAPTFCEKAVEVLQYDDQVKLVTCHTQRFSDNGYNDVIRHTPATITGFLKFNCSLGSSMFRKKDWSDCGGYDEEMRTGFEDWEFYIRLLKKGGRSFVIPEVLFYYRLRPGSKTEEANNLKYGLLRNLYLKHKDLYIANFDQTIDHLLWRLEVIENSEKKVRKSRDFKVGSYILSPVRFFKKYFSK